MARAAPDTAPLFVRIPQAQAARSTASRSSRAAPSRRSSPSCSRAASAIPPPPRRSIRPAPTLGRHSFRPYDAEVLTLEGVAELLRVDPARSPSWPRAASCPGRLIGGEWRFARSAVLAWLAAPAPRSPEDGDQ